MELCCEATERWLKFTMREHGLLAVIFMATTAAALGPHLEGLHSLDLLSASCVGMVFLHMENNLSLCLDQAGEIKLVQRVRKH